MQMQGGLASGGGGSGEIHITVGPSAGLAPQARSRLHSIGLQLAMLDRELDASDYEALRGLDSDNPPGVRGLVDVDIARLPTYMYKEAGSGAGIRYQACCPPPKQAFHDLSFLISFIVRSAG